MIEFNLPAPPSANCIWRVGHGRIYKSDEYRAWLDVAVWNVKEQLGREMPSEPLCGPFAVTITVRPADKRYRDIDNYAKPCLDLLEYAGLIDNDKHVESLIISRGPVADRHHVTIELRGTDDQLQPQS